jgi:ankyrin repeat protein
MFRLASVTGNAEVGAELIRNGADVNIPDSEGKNALMQATINNHHALVKVNSGN